MSFRLPRIITLSAALRVQKTAGRRADISSAIYANVPCEIVDYHIDDFLQVSRGFAPAMAPKLPRRPPASVTNGPTMLSSEKFSEFGAIDEGVSPFHAPLTRPNEDLTLLTDKETHALGRDAPPTEHRRGVDRAYLRAVTWHAPWAAAA